MTPFVAVPIRSFTAMERLAPMLNAAERSSLIQDLAVGVLEAAVAAGCDSVIVTADEAVEQWASTRSHVVIADPGSGLDAAARAAIVAAGARPWAVVHGDLPLVLAADITALFTGSLPALAPSHDGGTSAVAGFGASFPFRFGPGSLRRHLAATRGRVRVVSRPGLAVDVDRPADLAILGRLGTLALERETRAR